MFRLQISLLRLLGELKSIDKTGSDEQFNDNNREQFSVVSHGSSTVGFRRLTCVCWGFITIPARFLNMAIAHEATQLGTDVVHRTRYDSAQSEPVSTTICEALAEVEDVDVTNLDIHLYDYLDPEAIDTLMATRTPTSDWQMEIAIDDYILRLSTDGEIILTTHPE